MDISTLAEFCELARTGSFSKAARRLSTTQPVLTRHIQKLEQELGYPLLDRTTRQVSLNDAGELFLPYAQQIVDTFQNYSRAVRQNANAGRLRIGMTELFSRSSIHDAIFRYASACHVNPEITEGPQDQLEEQLSRRQLDVVIAYEKSGKQSNDFSRLTYFSDELAVVLPTTHPQARKPSITLESLADESFIFLRKEMLVGRLSLECCEQAGFEPKVVHYSKFEDNILEMVRKGIGISILLKRPRNVIGASVVEIEPTAQVDLNLICRMNDPVVREFLEFIRDNRPKSGR